MSQTWKIILAVIITAVVVGCGVYAWQQEIWPLCEFPAGNSDSNLEEKTSASSPKEGWSVLYSDEENGFRIVTQSNCVSYFKAKGDKESVSISLPKAKEWTGEIKRYIIETQDEFNKAVREAVSSEPLVELKLKNGLLLTTWSSQDRPSFEDLPGECWTRSELL